MPHKIGESGEKAPRRRLVGFAAVFASLALDVESSFQHAALTP
jgi:hypothetical protein